MAARDAMKVSMLFLIWLELMFIESSLSSIAASMRTCH